MLLTPAGILFFNFPDALTITITRGTDPVPLFISNTATLSNPNQFYSHTEAFNSGTSIGYYVGIASSPDDVYYVVITIGGVTSSMEISIIPVSGSVTIYGSEYNVPTYQYTVIFTGPQPIHTLITLTSFIKVVDVFINNGSMDLLFFQTDLP